MKNIKKIFKLFEERGGVLSTSDLMSEGISRYYINKLLDAHLIERVKQGLYRLTKGPVDEWVEVEKLIPQGIFCLFSAAYLHELSVFVSSEYHVAIPRKSKVTIFDYPPIQLYYWSEHHYQLGKTGLIHNGFQLTAYDSEKTVCDFIKFRNKVGFDTTKEVIIAYLRKPQRNINRLMEYARELRISSVVSQYLEVLV